MQFRNVGAIAVSITDLSNSASLGEWVLLLILIKLHPNAKAITWKHVSQELQINAGVPAWSLTRMEYYRNVKKYQGKHHFKLRER